MSSQLSIINKNEISNFELNQEKIDLLKNTICKGVTNEEFQIFTYACQRTGLDPFMKQIHAVKRPDKRLGRDVMSIQTGIDGYRLIAERTKKYSPGREYTYQYNDKGELVSSTAYIKKMTPDGTWHEVSATAFYIEYVQTKYDGTPTQFWAKMKHNQLGKCAEALALRKAFPADLSGIYTTEEMGQADMQMADNVEVISKKEERTQTIHPKPMSKGISNEQSKILEEILDKCSPEYKSKFMSRIKTLGCDSCCDLNEEMYEKAIVSCTNQMNLYLELKKELDVQLSKTEILEVVDA